MLKNKGNLLLVLISCLFIFAVPVNAVNNGTINILLNGKKVNFTDNSGYPYLDENKRTMVPLRVTMESAGFVVGYDVNSHTAVVITEHNRIEVPIGTNKIYTNNELKENDTIAVVNNGRTYLPIRAVLENTGYTVEWAGNTNTVNAYNFSYDSNELVPYSTSSSSTLLENVLKGNVVYIQGEYYATPDYVRMLSNVKIHYWDDDLNKAIYPQDDIDRFNSTGIVESEMEWISGLNFDYLLFNDKELEKFGVDGNPSNIPGYSYVYAFYSNELTNIKLVYPVDELNKEFINSSDAIGIFNGIQMKRENDKLFFRYSDVKEKNIYK